jgi:hypothetical protein
VGKKKQTLHQITYAEYARQRYITFFTEIIDHPAFLDLSANAQALILRMGILWAKTRHKLGDQNGRLQISTERIQHYLNLSERKAINAMHEVIEHGYVEITHPEDWTRRQARQYRLCWLPCDDKPPGKDWLQWNKKKPVFTVPKHRNRKKSIKTTTAIRAVLSLPQ